MTDHSDRNQRRRYDLIGVVAVAVLLLLVFAEVVFAGKTLSAYANAAGVGGIEPIEGAPVDIRLDRGASSWAFEPWGEVNDRILEQGDLPLWNPYQGIGAPQAANMQSGVLDPLLLPANLNSSLWVRDLLMLATYVAGAIVMFGFVRVLGLRAFESAVASGAFGLTGWFLLYSNNTFSRAYVFLPLLFLLVELIVREWRPWHILALGIATAGSITIGMPEATFVVLLMSGVYAIIRSIQTRAANSWRALLRLSAGFTLGLALAAPLLAIFLEYLPQSFSLHEGGTPTGVYVDPPRMILNLLVPFLGGEPLNASGIWTGTRGWLAAGTAMLAFVGLSGKTLTRRFNGVVFAGFALVIVLRVYDFGVLDWTGRLPILERVSYPAFALPGLPFVVAVVAGIGVAVLRAGDLSLRRFGVVVVLASVGILLLVGTPSNRALIEMTSDTEVLRNFGLAAFVFAGIAVAAVASAWWRPAAIVAGLLALIELMLLAPRGIYPDRIDPYPITPTVEALQELTTTDPLARIYAFDGELFPNTATSYGLYDIRMLDALYVDRYFRYLKEYIQPSILDRFVGGPWASLEETFTRYVDNPMLDLLGVRYLVTHGPLPNTDLMLDMTLVAPTDVRVLDIPGDPRSSVFVHAPGAIALPDPPDDASTLAIAFGMDSQAFEDPENDGVRFEVTGVDAAGQEVELFSEAYVPRVDPVMAEWRNRKISLVHEGERVRSLSVSTDALSNSSTDWAGLADLSYLEEPEDSVRQTTTLVAVADSSLVYSNLNALPRAWVANTIHGVDDVEGAIAFFDGRRSADGMVDFSPAEEVVIEGVESTTPAANATDLPTSLSPDTTLTSWKSASRRNAQGSWYWPMPGIRVGMPRSTARTKRSTAANVAFRAVAVPAGTSSVRFSYEPASFRLGLLVAFIGLGSYAAWVAISRLRERRMRSIVAIPIENEWATPGRSHDESTPPASSSDGDATPV